MIDKLQLSYTDNQKKLITADRAAKIFLSGKPGRGKTTAAVERCRYLLDNAKDYSQVLVFAPTREYQLPYQGIVSRNGQGPDVTTFAAFVQKSLNTFWPIVAKKANTERKTSPFFLTVDDEHAIMSRLIQPKVDSGYFSGAASSLPRIYNQIIIAMNRCAAIMMPFENYAEWMKDSWGGEKSKFALFDQVQECGLLYRELCQKNNLLGYSLRLDYFLKYLVSDPLYHKWIKNQKMHFIFDEIEEEVPAAHHFVRETAKDFLSVLLVCDDKGGYRNFMGADPYSGEQLETICNYRVLFTESFSSNPAVESLCDIIENPKLTNNELHANPTQAYTLDVERRYAKMIKNAVSGIVDLVNNKHIAPEDIAVISPLASDVTYIEMERSLRDNGIKTYLNNSSRPLIEGNITKNLLTLCSLVMPMKEFPVMPLDIVSMIVGFVKDVDPIRCELYVQEAFDMTKDENGKINYSIIPFENLPVILKQRLTAEMEKRFEKLRNWIEEQRLKENNTPDMVVYRFFTEILTDDGFISDHVTALNVCKVVETLSGYSKLLEFIKTNCADKDNTLPGWCDYFKTVSLGTVKTKFSEDIYSQPKGTVLITTVSSYLSMNRCNKYQIWLNVGSPKWRESYVSELTNDNILSRNWVPGTEWTSLYAEQVNTTQMIKKVCGLLNRCEMQVLAYASGVDEKGTTQKGKLLEIFDWLNRRFGNKKLSVPEKKEGSNEAQDGTLDKD